MSATWVIVNPYAGGGKAGRVWNRVQFRLRELYGDVELAITHTDQDVERTLREAMDQGASRVFAIGGDGTNHTLVNAILRLAGGQPIPFAYACIPAGTGRDFARGAGLPLNPQRALEQLSQGRIRHVDVGCLRIDDEPVRYFLNIASAGIGSDVVTRVNAVRKRRPWTFIRAVLGTIFQYDPERVRVLLDDAPWYEGGIYAVAVANGTTFGQGMKVAPTALIDDGMLDIALIDDLPRGALLRALPTVFNGSHITNPHVHTSQARRITISRVDGEVLGVEMDGEAARGRHHAFELLPRVLPMIL